MSIFSFHTKQELEFLHLPYNHLIKYFFIFNLTGFQKPRTITLITTKFTDSECLSNRVHGENSLEKSLNNAK